MDSAVRTPESGASLKHGALGHLSEDEELQHAVCAALIEAPDLDSTGIEVRAAAGTVTLSGSVRSPEDRQRALEIAEHQSGAQDIAAGELRVVTPA